ncbi:uncharacterized protein [Ptychodera flava]|uniref:uncharacterized protein n=1 Tax=Ptychodera flava TaxID=63121 RepID=UPI00396A8C14
MNGCQKTFSALRKASDKLTRFKNHTKFLQLCKQSNSFPRSLVWKYKPPVADTNLQNECTSIIEETARQLQNRLIRHYKTLTETQLPDKIQYLNDRLKNQTNERLFRRMNRRIQQQITKTDENMKRCHKAKLLKIIPTQHDENNIVDASSIANCDSGKTQRRFDKNTRKINAHRRYRRNLKIRHSSRSNGLVVNLSDKQLDESATHLLGRGLGFCPKPKSLDTKGMVYDCATYTRKVRLLHYFSRQSDDIYNTDTTPDVLKQYKPTKKWTPKPGIDKSVDVYCSKILNEVYAYQPARFNSTVDNLTLQERAALNELKDNENIVITKADKGGALVVLNKTDYDKECRRQLNDTNFYEREDSDVTVSVIKSLIEHCNILYRHDVIDEATFDALCNIDDSKEAYFYILPKIHKLSQEQLYNHVIPPGRPICSHINSPYRQVALWLDSHRSRLLQGRTCARFYRISCPS